MVDEAANDFLSVYNPAVSEIRAWLGVPFPPSFEFGEWIAGLTVAVLVLFALSALAYRGARPAVRLAYPYAGLMLLNGLGHTTGSIVTGGVLPGTWSAPPLLAASAWLLVSARRVRYASLGRPVRNRSTDARRASTPLPLDDPADGQPRLDPAARSKNGRT